MFESRRAAGRVRECHGDLHLGNIVQIDGQTTVFDGIEFNDELRWIDVTSDVALAAMDLHRQGLPALAHRRDNGDLEHSGDDDDGARVLAYYVVHRALVRAKVAAVRAAQAPQASGRDVRRHLAPAWRCIQTVAPGVLITHGPSGSGKTHATQSLVQACGAVRIRSDDGRKRRFAVDPLARGDAAQPSQRYGAQATRATCDALLRAADAVVQGGCSVILDATFLQRAQRAAAHGFARQRGQRCAILDFDAPVQTLRARVQRRASAARSGRWPCGALGARTTTVPSGRTGRRCCRRCEGSRRGRPHAGVPAGPGHGGCFGRTPAGRPGRGFRPLERPRAGSPIRPGR